MNKKFFGILISLLMIVITVSANENIITTDYTLFNSPPVADPGGPYNGFEGDEIMFDASGSYDPDGDVLLYRWYVGSDHTPETDWSHDPITYWIFDDDFDDYVWVEVSDGSMLDADKTTAFIENVIPDVDAGPDVSGDEGEEVTFNFYYYDPGTNDTHLLYFASRIGEGEVGIKRPRGDVTAWSWNEKKDVIIVYRIRAEDLWVDDIHFYTPKGQTLDFIREPDGFNKKHEANKNGSWTNFSGGHIGTDKQAWMTMQITPNSTTGKINISVILTYKDGKEVAKDNIIYEPKKSSLNMISGNIQFNFKYIDSGNFTASFFIIDDEGGNSSDTCTVTISNIAPTIQPFGPFKGEPGDTFELSATATDKGSDDLTFSWDFGDGSSEITNVYYNDGETPDDRNLTGGISPFTITDTIEHTYIDEDLYTITVTVQDDEGAQTQYTTTVSTPKAKSNIVKIQLFLQRFFFRFPFFEKILNQII